MASVTGFEQECKFCQVEVGASTGHRSQRSSLSLKRGAGVCESSEQGGTAGHATLGCSIVQGDCYKCRAQVGRQEPVRADLGAPGERHSRCADRVRGAAAALRGEQPVDAGDPGDHLHRRRRLPPRDDRQVQAESRRDSTPPLGSVSLACCPLALASSPSTFGVGAAQGDTCRRMQAGPLLC